MKKQVKKVKKFAFLPTKIEGKIIWLKNYMKIYKFESFEKFKKGHFYKIKDWHLIRKYEGKI